MKRFFRLLALTALCITPALANADTDTAATQAEINAAKAHSDAAMAEGLKGMHHATEQAKAANKAMEAHLKATEQAMEESKEAGQAAADEAMDHAHDDHDDHAHHGH